MAETFTVHEDSSVGLSNNNNQNSNANISDNSQLKAEFTFTSKEHFESPTTPIQIMTNHPVSSNTTARLPIYHMPPMNRPSSNYFPPQNSYFPYNQTSSPLYFPVNMNQADTQAQLVAFTPSLMSLQVSYPDSRIRQRNQHPPRLRMHNQTSNEAFSSIKHKSETTSQPQYYVDSFASNFADKPSSNSNTKSKIKHVTFQESNMTDELNNATPSTSVFNGSNYPTPAVPPSFPMYFPPRHHNRYQHPNPYYYPQNNFYPYHPRVMMNPRYTGRTRGMNMMATPSLWSPPQHDPNQQMSYVHPPFPPRQLYDPNKPKTSSISRSQNASNVIRSITPKNKTKTKQINTDDTSAVSTPEPPAHPITILRKPSTENDVITPLVSINSSLVDLINAENQSAIEEQSNIPSEEEQTVQPSEDDRSTSPNESLSSDKLLSILQSANCISSLNDYAQQRNFRLNYEFSSSTSSSSFTCLLSINNRKFPASSSCTSKVEAQKVACDQALRILYRESCAREQSLPEFSNKHDYIAFHSLTKFQSLNVNEFLLGRKTIACMLMVTDGLFEQANVISIGTGNKCLDETNLTYATDGTVLHDCHAEILARRGLIRYLFEQIKQSSEKKSSSIFEYNSTTHKYYLRENITFHMYISSLPCGNASLNISSNSLRYKQGQIEGTLLASTSSTKYPIKSCSDKICRWNILGIQGGLLTNLLTKPIYLETITLACEATFDRNHVKFTLCERLNKHFPSLPTPFSSHLPDIDCPQTKSFQQERQVAKLQTNAFAWNITQLDRTELLEPMTGKLKSDRSVSLLSKQKFFEDFTNFIQTNFSDDKSLSYTTYQQAKQLDKIYCTVKNLISTAFQMESLDTNISWLSKSDQLEQFSIQ